MDFINNLSIYQFLLQNFRQVRRLLWYLKVLSGGDKYTHFGRFGIKDFYGKFGLKLIRLYYIGTVLPMRNAISEDNHVLLEKFWPMKRLFGRVLLGVFIN